MRRQIGLLAVAIASTVWVGQAQSKPAAGPAPCKVDPQPDPCGTTPAATGKPSATEKFPFPGEPAASDSKEPSLGGVPAAPETPDSPAAKKDFPFPGDASSGSASSSNHLVAAGVTVSMQRRASTRTMPGECVVAPPNSLRVTTALRRARAMLGATVATNARSVWLKSSRPRRLTSATDPQQAKPSRKEARSSCSMPIPRKISR